MQDEKYEETATVYLLSMSSVSNSNIITRIRMPEEQRRNTLHDENGQLKV